MESLRVFSQSQTIKETVGTKKANNMTQLGKLQRREDFRWEMKDLNNDITLLIDPSKGPMLEDSDEGELFEFYVNTIAIGQDEFTVTDIDVAVIKAKAYYS
jgi:hypothetical protein